jgi:alkylhydroperoxidase/carboxymuconolactone decarboxylase family protein YurZ
MENRTGSVSEAFQLFVEKAPGHARAWMDAVRGLEGATALDKKTAELAYIAVLSALRLQGGIPFHVTLAKQAGASRDEVVSAVLIGLPAAGNGVTEVLPAALRAYEAE